MEVTRWLVGSGLWLLAVLLPVPRPALAVLMVALVLVPTWLAWKSEMGRDAARTGSRLGLASLLATAPLVAAYASPPGAAAGLLTVPWLGVCLAFAASGVVHGMRSLPSILTPARAGALLTDASAVLLGVGATFVALERSAIGLLGFEAQILLVTGVHFHVLGFGLLAVTADLAERRSTPATAASYPLLLGITVTAAGFGFSSTLLQLLGAMMVAGGGLLVSAALALSAGSGRRWRRAAGYVASGVLAVGIPMGVLWAAASHFGLPFVGFDTMVASHGALNTLGTSLAALSVWARHQ